MSSRIHSLLLFWRLFSQQTAPFQKWLQCSLHPTSSTQIVAQTSPHGTAEVAHIYRHEAVLSRMRYFYLVLLGHWLLEPSHQAVKKPRQPIEKSAWGWDMNLHQQVCLTTSNRQVCGPSWEFHWTSYLVFPPSFAQMSGSCYFKPLYHSGMGFLYDEIINTVLKSYKQQTFRICFG